MTRLSNSAHRAFFHNLPHMSGKSDQIFMQIFRNISLDKKVFAKFQKSSGPALAETALSECSCLVIVCSSNLFILIFYFIYLFIYWLLHKVQKLENKKLMRIEH